MNPNPSGAILFTWVIIASFGPIIFCGLTDRTITKNVVCYSLLGNLIGIAFIITLINIL